METTTFYRVIWGLGFRVRVVSWVWGLGFWGFRLQGLGCLVGFGFRGLKV